MSLVDFSVFYWFWWWLQLWCCTGNVSLSAGATCPLVLISIFGISWSSTTSSLDLWRPPHPAILRLGPWSVHQEGKAEVWILTLLPQSQPSPQCVTTATLGIFFINLDAEGTEGIAQGHTGRDKAGTDSSICFFHNPTLFQTIEVGNDYLFTQTQLFTTILADILLISRDHPGKVESVTINL